MKYITQTCPLCDKEITIDESLEYDGIIKIRTKRRSTILVHKRCYDMGNAIRREITK